MLRRVQVLVWNGLAISATFATLFVSAPLASGQTIVGWGSNTDLQISPVPVSPYSKVAAGFTHGLGLLNNGALKNWGAWGGPPFSPPFGPTFTAISANGNHNLALDTAGTIYAWGQAIGTPPSGTNYTAIAAGEYHGLALKGGDAYGWGNNTYGQAPAFLAGPFTAVACGGGHSLLLTPSGIVGLGDNSQGQAPPFTPGTFLAIAAGHAHSLAIDGLGNLVSWGNNTYGQVTLTGLANAYAPFVAVACGFNHSLAISSTGTLVIWGSNVLGQVESPPSFPTLHAYPGPYYACAGGEAHSLAIAHWTTIHGFPHVPLGQALLTPNPVGDLLVSNIGSSGQDGVEVNLHSALGGGAALDVGPVMNTAGAVLRTRHKGWDGLIYGNHRLTSNGDGTGTFTFDFSSLGATGVRVVEYDASGAVVSDELSDGPVAARPWVPNFFCPDGSVPVIYIRWYNGWLWISWMCATSGPYTAGDPHGRIIVTPTLPAGTPDTTSIEVLDLAASGIPQMTLLQADVATFGVPNSGLGQALLSEVCDDPGGCSPDQLTLHVDNLGSSGQDGVSIDLGPNAGGVEVAMNKGNCCRGHVIIMKAYDDAGEELRVSRTQTTDPDGTEILDADYSALGATGFRLTLFDDAGVVVGPPDGTAFINGGPRPSFTGHCPPGSREWWISTGPPSNPVWVFVGCINMCDFVLPGYGDVPGVSSFRVEPLEATSSFGQRTRCAITSDDDEGLVIAGVAIIPATVYVSGLPHTPVGNAELGDVVGRRLPVKNLGSSGQDGVEIQLNSAFGGGAEIDLEPFLSTPDASVRIRHKGWDGLIYGNHRMTSNGDGTATVTLDYSDVGATSIQVDEYDTSGTLISSEAFPGSIGVLPLDVPVFYCPPGTIPTVGVWYGKLCYTCPWIYVFVFYCDGTMYTSNFVITPTLPVGTPDSPGIESMSITGSGMPELTVSNANIRTFGVQAWGLDPAQISEQCDDPAGCPPGQRTLHVDNLGSSGQDGVAIALPPDNGGVSVASQRPRCCRGHVIIMKAFDDAGQELRVSRTQTTDPDGTEILDADYSALGATGFHLTLLNDSGVVVGPPGGTDIFNGGPRPYLTNRCPPETTEWWILTGPPSNPVWVFQGCVGGPSYDFVLPDGTTVPNVSSFRVEPLDAASSFGPRVRCEFASDDPEGLVIEDVTVTPIIPGDLNCDGAVNNFDITPFVLALTNVAGYEAQFPACPIMNGDINGDGMVNNFDITPFVALLTSP